MTTTRILLHTDVDGELLTQITEILDAAVADHPTTFVRIDERADLITHYGYHTPTLAATVLSTEYGTRFMRLVIRRGEHPVFDRLAALIAAQLTG